MSARPAHYSTVVATPRRDATPSCAKSKWSTQVRHWGIGHWRREARVGALARREAHQLQQRSDGGRIAPLTVRAVTRSVSIRCAE